MENNLEILAPTNTRRLNSTFLQKLSHATGVSFVPGQVGDVDGTPLYVGDVVIHSESRLHYVVQDANRAVRQDHVILRSDGGWRRDAAEGHCLTITHNASGNPVCVTWQTEDHDILEFVFEHVPVAIHAPMLAVHRE